MSPCQSSCQQLKASAASNYVEKKGREYMGEPCASTSPRSLNKQDLMQSTDYG